MIRVMEVTMVNGRLESNEVALKKFDAASVIDYVSENFDNDVLPDDLLINERHDEFITVTVSSVHTDDGDIDVLFVGKRQDFSGEMMS